MLEMNATNALAVAAVVAVLLALGGLLTALGEARRRRAVAPLLDVTLDGWTATGKVDLSPTEELGSDDLERKKRPFIFVFKAEDVRIVRSASGVDLHEIRWRHATQEEAERAMSTCNRKSDK